MKLVEDHDGDTHWAAYTVAFAGAVYVLDVLQKKSKSGVGTSKHVKDRVLARFRAAEQDHERRQSGGATLATISRSARAAATSFRISVREKRRSVSRRRSLLASSGRRSVKGV